MSDHLLAYFCSDHSDDDVGALRMLADELRAENWTLGAPEFIDQSESGEELGPGDEAARTVGVALALSAPGELIQTPGSELNRLIEALARFSKERTVDFEVDYNDEIIGTVERGKVCDSLQRGLLDTW